LNPTVSGAEQRDGTESPFITVIVPVRNEAPFIRKTLEQLLSQQYAADRFEVIVADGESTDGTRDVVQSMQEHHPNLRLLRNTKRWSSAGRNLGVRAARGDYVVVVDGHSDLDSRYYLRDLAHAFSRSGADCLGRPQPLDVAGATALQRAIAVARSSRLGHHPASWIYSSDERFVKPQSVGIAYRREIFDAVGLFDEDFDACEDVEFNHRIDRAGLRCFFSPKVQVRYHPRSSLLALFRQMCRYGRGRMRLLAKYPETFSFASVIPAIFLVGLAAGGVAACFSPWLATGYAAALGTYVITILVASLVLAARARDACLLPWLPLVFAAIHSGAGTGVLMEAVRQARRRCWRLSLGSEAINRQTINLETMSLASSDVHVLPHPSSHDEKSSGILNVLTVDVEDYFQVTGFESFIDRSQWGEFESRVHIGTDKIMRALDVASVRGTFFVLGWLAERYPRLVRRIRAAGHEIGCHSYWHRLIYQQTPDEFRADLRRARDAIEDAIGAPINAYRAPCFSITRRSLWALDILIEEGFTFDSSIYPTLHDRYGIPGTPTRPHQIIRPGGSLWEFPMAVRHCFGYPVPVGGGGYFRMYPYGFTRRSLDAINAAGRPFVVYLHPWELDPDQPRLQQGRLSAVRHYANLQQTESRLQQLLRDFRFGSMSEAHAHLESNGVVSRRELTAAA
jgi:polysaccharide deacetylase family protein (PEP-CTERM system associated)